MASCCSARESRCRLRRTGGRSRWPTPSIRARRRRPMRPRCRSAPASRARTSISFVRLVPSVTVSGVLTGPDGPMAHTALSLVPPGADLSDFELAGVATAVTDGRGAFAFLAVVPGEYTLSSSLARLTSERTGEGKSLWASQALNVGTRASPAWRLRCSPECRIERPRGVQEHVRRPSKPAQRRSRLQPVARAVLADVPPVVRAGWHASAPRAIRPAATSSMRLARQDGSGRRRPSRASPCWTR